MAEGTEQQGTQNPSTQHGNRQEGGQKDWNERPRRRRDGGAPARRLQERGREVYDQAQALGTSVEQAVDEVGEFLRAQLERRPYLTLATAAMVGYVLGGGLPRRLTRFAFGVGSRLALEMFVREITAGALAATVSDESQRSVS